MRINYIVFEKSRRGGEYTRESVAFTHYGRSEDNRIEDGIVARLQDAYGLDWTGASNGVRIERRES